MNQTVKNFLPGLVGEFDLPESYNVAPTDPVRVVRERDGTRELAEVRWGIVPPRSPKFGGGKPVINARIETVATNGLFRNSFESHRCIVPALGYYEWQAREDGKQPFFIHEPDGALGMAGIISAWRDPDKDDDDPGKWRLSMAIITRDAHVAPGEVHDRMPACLTPDAFDDWLSPDLEPKSALAILDRTSVEVAHELVHHEVSREVNSVRNDGAQLIDPL